MTPALEKKRDELANGEDTRAQCFTMKEGWGPRAQSFATGFDAALQALKDEAPEFDEQDFREKYEIENGPQGSMQLVYLIKGARFQFDQLKAKLALAEQHAKDCQHEMRMQLAAIQRLEAEAKRYRDALEFYADWKNWDWASEKVYEDTPLTNIKSDDERLSYVEADGDTFENNFGGKRARKALGAKDE